MRCGLCEEILGEDDTAVDVDIDISRDERYNVILCKTCAKQLAAACDD